MTLKTYTQDVRSLQRRMLKMLDRRVIHKHFVAHYGEEVIKQVVNSAKFGIGPNDAPYRGYADSYKKQIKADGGRKYNLRGIGRSGIAGGMLDLNRFSWHIGSDGRLWLVWTAENEQMGIYAEVHDKGLRIGKFGPSIKRAWMHFESSRSARAVEVAYRKTMDELATIVARGGTPR